ncbi:MAG: beta-aspartyl-peptidase [Gemmatimonadaceae bacterium]|nr:beta-aspartyl-peptidase [Gemmatimonadaceae bacterium]
MRTDAALPVLRLLTDCDLYAPHHVGRVAILVAGGRIAWIGTERPALPAALGVETIDAVGLRVIPGLIDGHAHLTGGGGEAGPHTKVPPLALSRFTLGGVTTAIGVLGTDDVTRTTGELITAVHALRAEGLNAWAYTGGYHVPLTTLTGSVRGDMAFVECLIGVGELALSDHRSSQPTLDELLRIAADAHVGGLMTGKAGIVHLHMGDGVRGLQLVRDALAQSELPPRVFNPTHVNRRRALFDEAIALARGGCSIDVTAFPVDEGEDAYDAAEALERYRASGAPPERITVSSDGGGCLPVFDGDGRVASFDVGRPAALIATIVDAVARGLALEAVLPAFTTNVARLLRLPHKGHISVGSDADLVILDARGGVRDVMIGGEWMVRAATAVRRGAFDGGVA